MQPRTVMFASLLPDVPLFILTMWYFLRYEVDFGPRYDTLFYNDPLWVITHNLFHGPLVIAAIALVGALLYRRNADDHRGARRGAWLLSFAFGTGLHSFVDIFTHHADGPLLLFPFNWSLRYVSPVSYWDPNHFGRIVAPIDLGLTLIASIYLVVRSIRLRRRAALLNEQLQVENP